MIDLSRSRPEGRPWDEPGRWWSGMTAATQDLPAPVAVLDEGALQHNAWDLLVRAGGVPVRLATKSVRVRAIIDAVLKLPGYRGLLAYTLAEALWLAEEHDDIVVAYPTTDHDALRRLAADARAAAQITLMIDDPTHLDLIDALSPAQHRPAIRIAIDVDAAWRTSSLGYIGVRRSPLATVGAVTALARKVLSRPGFTLVGMQMYEAQIAGTPDTGGARRAAVRAMKRASGAELRERRAAIAEALLRLAPLEFIAGGGTGSVEWTAADESITEVTAGSGLLAGHLFDGYPPFRPAPAAAFALDVVRRPAPQLVTVLGGGWVASGAAGRSRLPLPVWPRGLHLLAAEGAGEVQTPLEGIAAGALALGDRVWFRHAKSGELSERVGRFALIRDGVCDGFVPTYRGEGKSFL